MAGRNYISPEALKLREAHLIRAPVPHPRPHPHPHPHPALIIDDPRRIHHPAAVVEERLALQQRDIQTLLVDNQRLAAIHVALKQELAAAQQELRHLSATAENVKAERDAQVREVYERSMKMEAEARLIGGMTAELAQVRGDIQKFTADRKELTTKLQEIEGEVLKVRAESKKFLIAQAEIDAMQQELQRGRAAVEYEKKVYADNLEQSQYMEKNMVSLTREIKKLQEELANAEKRARAAAAAAVAATPGSGYAGGYGNPEMGYGGNPYPDPYAMHQVQGGRDGGPQYGSDGPYDMQRPHMR